jgi:hypothetical protein
VFVAAILGVLAPSKARAPALPPGLCQPIGLFGSAPEVEAPDQTVCTYFLASSAPSQPSSQKSSTSMRSRL